MQRLREKCLWSIRHIGPIPSEWRVERTGKFDRLLRRGSGFSDQEAGNWGLAQKHCNAAQGKEKMKVRKLVTKQVPLAERWKALSGAMQVQKET